MGVYVERVGDHECGLQRALSLSRLSADSRRVWSAVYGRGDGWVLSRYQVRGTMITIGMATHRDFDGAYFTLQALRLFHDLSGVELLVVDNAPDSPESDSLRNAMGWMSNARYVAAPEVTGTAAPRNRVFDEARGEWVMCIDSHVFLAPGAIEWWKVWIEKNPQSKDLIQGPLMDDSMRVFATHFDDRWGGEMWGKWAYDTRYESGEPFEIPAMGLGLFACRKDSWLRFNDEFRGFGGEEHYIHEKYRQAGRTTWCLPGLKWLHRFQRPHGVHYPLTRFDKVRNYVIGHRELGLPLASIYKHFVQEVGFPQEEWDAIVGGRVVGESETTTTTSGCGCGSRRAEQPDYAAHDPHFARIQELARDAKQVVSFASVRDPHFPAIAATRPESYVSSSLDTLPQVHGTEVEFEGSRVTLSADDPRHAVPRVCDLLYVDVPMRAEELIRFLADWATFTTRIILRGTTYRGRTYEGGPGILPAVRYFVSEHKEWTVTEHEKTAPGMLVLSRRPADKKEPPSLITQGWNFLSAVTRRVADGWGDIDQEKFELRLAECSLCPSRNGAACGECGCPIERKASWPSEMCPLGKW